MTIKEQIITTNTNFELTKADYFNGDESDNFLQ